LAGGLLGETRWPPLCIALAKQSSAAQRRCTLAHEIVHLERGFGECGLWADREERQVHAEAARRLISTPELAEAIRALGGSQNLSELAVLLNVDTQTVRVRLQLLDRPERRLLHACTGNDVWSVA
jgi:Zn-dependent peptidase ImmA (M78 family)